MRHLERVLASCAIAGFAAVAHAAEGNGLTVNADNLYWPRWQGRLSLVSPAPAWRSALASNASAAVGSSSLGLMSDYYVTGSLLGPKRAGGFRATSGILIGPRAQAWAGTGTATFAGNFSVQRRAFGQSPTLLPGDAAAETSTLPYLGIGYTGLSPRGGWSFSADLGVISLGASSAVKFGRVVNGTQSLDDTLRDMRWSPMLQLGVSYSF